MGENMKLLRRKDLIPTQDELRNAAYCVLSGDPCIPHLSQDGSKPETEDLYGFTKIDTHRAALTRDPSYFQAFVKQAKNDEWDKMKSKRIYEKKRSGGERPIDIPPEGRKMLSYYVLYALQDRFEAVLHGGQYAARRRSRNYDSCKSPGATLMDHMATDLFLRIREGKHWALTIDLKDAFGNIPFDAIRSGLASLDLEPEAISYVLNLARIHSVHVDRETKKARHFLRKVKGVEQGNPLSPMLLELTMAPILKEIEAALGVEPFTWVDDIVFLGSSREQMVETFDMFKKLTKEAGFKNVRPLAWGISNDAKASRILDVREEPLEIVSTYSIDHRWIGLTAKKTEKAREDVNEVLSSQGKPPGLEDLRRQCQAMAISTKWFKSVGLYGSIRIPTKSFQGGNG